MSYCDYYEKSQKLCVLDISGKKYQELEKKKRLVRIPNLIIYTRKENSCLAYCGRFGKSAS